MLFTSFCNTDTFTFSQTKMIDVHSSLALLYCFPSTVRNKIPQRFSMEFRSGEFAGDSITCTPILHKPFPCRVQHEWKEYAGISKMDIQSLLQKVKGGYLADLGNQLHSSGFQGMQYSFGLDNQTQPRLLVTDLVCIWKIFFLFPQLMPIIGCTI